jgi:hypothetical protein
MAEAKDKKKFAETGVGKFINEKLKPIAGASLELIGDLTGRESIEKIGQFLSNKVSEDSEQSLQFKALQIEFEEKKLEFELEFQRIEIELFKAEAADRESARNREIEYMKASGGKKDWLMGTAVIVALVMYIGAFSFLAYGPEIPEGKKDLFNMGVGQVFTFAGMVFAYYLGTTKSSRAKDDMIKRSIDKS